MREDDCNVKIEISGVGRQRFINMIDNALNAEEDCLRSFQSSTLKEVFSIIVLEKGYELLNPDVVLEDGDRHIVDHKWEAISLDTDKRWKVGHKVFARKYVETKAVCSNCKWWSFGDCKRNPPKTVSVPARQFSDDVGLRNDPARLDTVWPSTQPNDFCGEHEERTV